jgi:hypothetical protein
MNIFIIIITILSILLLYIFYLTLLTIKYINNEPNYDLCQYNKKYSITLLDNNLNNIKTGDLILFSSYTYYPLFRIFGDHTFSHIGIVVKFNNQLYSLELFDIYPINNKIYYNKNLIPLYTRLNTYTGTTFIASLKKPLNNIQLQKLFKFINKKAKFYNPIELYFAKLHNFNFKNKYSCSSYIYHLLIYIGLIQNDNINNIDIHKYLINFCNNYLYNYPVEILYTNSQIKKIVNKSIIYPDTSILK